jgi:hypothetical protein
MNDQKESNPRTVSTFLKVLLLLLLLAGFVTTFFSGYYVAQLQSVPGQPAPTPSITSGPTVKPGATGVPQQSTEFLPGKYYFDDTLIAVTKSKPVRSFAVSVRRLEQQQAYVHNTGASYFNGTSWERDTDSRNAPDATIISNDVVNKWEVMIDPTRVLKQSAQGDITVGGTRISFDTGLLYNEIGMRSLPGYTKFMSRGSGTLTINDEKFDAFMLYTRIYSLNATDIQFYNQPIGLTTDWLAFWDTQGDFYHIDVTDVETPTPIYQSHRIGVYDDVDGTVAKTFSVTVNRNSLDDPSIYTVQLPSPIATTLKYTRSDKLNKAPNASYTWFTGNVTGEVIKTDGTVVAGVGLMEYIHN